ncbi:hypothetical protein B0H15DRAFT_1022124 [Mycena belliarum]|uniref:Uncharacterized protein n=1 Tax=Mycena belliarum TaxID=1033014 RepID=A0AAD6XP98_9AGAR|nr:hypothetical protein B0H15DRAFT_1022124 [Mycena belliae]
MSADRGGLQSKGLTHTRSDPPTFKADLLRQEHARRNVALLEARDREEDRPVRVPASTAPPLTMPLLRGVTLSPRRW